MNIIKEFSDFEFYSKIYEGPHDPKNDFWKWGLSDDGDLYFTSSEDNNKWRLFNSPSNGSIATKISIREMTRIVNNFGTLLVFI